MFMSINSMLSPETFFRPRWFLWLDNFYGWITFYGYIIFHHSRKNFSQKVLYWSIWSARLCWKISPLSKPILDGTRGETVEGKRPLEVLYIGRAAAQDHHQVEFYSSTVGKDPAGSQIKERFKITNRFSAKQSVMPPPVWRKTYHIIILILILILIPQMRG